MTNAVAETPTRGIRAALHGLFARIGRGLVAYTEMLSRADEMKKLTAMSDKELARIGIRRDEIVRHVFRDRVHF